MANDIIPITSAEVLPQQQIENLIYTARGVQVMLDRDLARLYQVTTSALNQAVKRNIDRFPEDFRFQLTEEEWVSISSQNVTTSASKRPKTSLPFVFTEEWCRSTLGRTQEQDGIRNQCTHHASICCHAPIHLCQCRNVPAH